MRIRVDYSALKDIHWYEYAARFLFGGAITAVAAMIGSKYGPAVGGLFLAFPAIFPAGATLGSAGLATFACAAWKLAPVLPSGFMLLAATFAWLCVSFVAWRVDRMIRKRLLQRRKATGIRQPREFPNPRTIV
jgi:hypothetical protein